MRKRHDYLKLYALPIIYNAAIMFARYHRLEMFK